LPTKSTLAITLKWKPLSTNYLEFEKKQQNKIIVFFERKFKSNSAQVEELGYKIINPIGTNYDEEMH
jgi:hypothetical protein